MSQTARPARTIAVGVSTNATATRPRHLLRSRVLIGADNYDGLVETVAILSDSEAVAAIRAAIEKLESGAE